MKHLFILLISIVATLSLQAQTKELEGLWRRQMRAEKDSFEKAKHLTITADSLSKIFDRQRAFGMYRDNYFITGIPTNEDVTNSTADVKFQISISQRLMKSRLPFHTFVTATYTQKSFWNLYENSSPFFDNNYNPALVLNKPLVINNQFKGMVLLSIEHESNGQGDSLLSRSWNFASLTGSYLFNKRLSAQIKTWVPWGVDDDNPDLMKYKGYVSVTLNYRSANDCFWASIMLNPSRASLNSQIELNFKLQKRYNHYLFFQWYQGYAESLIEYDKYTSMIRAGICIKPLLRNLY